MLTEEEAEARACCGPEGCGLFHGGRRWCIASTCMAWRWGYELDDYPPTHNTTMRKTDRGFCGLAGDK